MTRPTLSRSPTATSLGRKLTKPRSKQTGTTSVHCIPVKPGMTTRGGVAAVALGCTLEDFAGVLDELSGGAGTEQPASSTPATHVAGRIFIAHLTECWYGREQGKLPVSTTRSPVFAAPGLQPTTASGPMWLLMQSDSDTPGWRFFVVKVTAFSVGLATTFVLIQRPVRRSFAAALAGLNRGPAATIRHGYLARRHSA